MFTLSFYSNKKKVSYLLLLISFLLINLVSAANIRVEQRKRAITRSKSSTTTTSSSKIIPAVIGGVGTIAVVIMGILFLRKNSKKNNNKGGPNNNQGGKKSGIKSYDEIKKQLENDFLSDYSKGIQKADEFKKEIMKVLSEEKNVIKEFIKLKNETVQESYIDLIADRVWDFTLYYKNRMKVAELVKQTLDKYKDQNIELEKEADEARDLVIKELKDEFSNEEDPTKKLKGEMLLMTPKVYRNLREIYKTDLEQNKKKKVKKTDQDIVNDIAYGIGSIYLEMPIMYHYAKSKDLVYLFFQYGFAQDSCFAAQSSRLTSSITYIGDLFWEFKTLESLKKYITLFYDEKEDYKITLKGFIRKYFLENNFQRVFAHYESSLAKKHLAHLAKYPKLYDASLLKPITIKGEIAGNPSLEKKFNKMRDKYFYKYVKKYLPSVIGAIMGYQEFKQYKAKIKKQQEIKRQEEERKKNELSKQEKKESIQQEKKESSQQEKKELEPDTIKVLAIIIQIPHEVKGRNIVIDQVGIDPVIKETFKELKIPVNENVSDEEFKKFIDGEATGLG